CTGLGCGRSSGSRAFERGAPTLGQPVQFAGELAALTGDAKASGAADDPVIRERITRAWAGLAVMRAHATRTLGEGNTEIAGAPSVAKLLWARWHRDLGELAMAVRGAPSLLAAHAPDEHGDVFDDWQRLFLFTRADTIYGGSDEIQRNIISERVLGLPREARP